jgi:hypothetical protein
MSELARTDGAFARVARLPLLAPLRARDFRLVWFGESVSLLGPSSTTWRSRAV